MDILKETSVEKDIVDLLQIRRLTHFGHVNRISKRHISKVTTTWLHTWTSVERKIKKKKWLNNIRETART